MRDLCRVLVVEDEEILRKGLIITTDWAAAGAIVIGEAKDGETGKELALRLAPDIIVTDIAMPALDGLTMIESLVEHLLDTEFIIISGHAEFSFAKKAVDFGVTGYVLKPIDPAEFSSVLERAVKSVLQRREMHAKGVRLEQLQDQSKNFPAYNFEAGADYRDSYVYDALQLIHRHYAEHLNMQDIAEHLQISERNLAGLFKEKTGYTFLEYITLYRMKNATQLLQNKELQVYEVASLVGYKDYRYFCKLFKSSFGVTPLEYKKGNVPF